MSLQQALDRLATSANLCSPTEATGLEDLTKLFDALLGEFSGTAPSEIVNAGTSAGDALGRLVAGSSEDPDADFEHVMDMIGYAQAVVGALDGGTDPAEVPWPGSEPRQEDVDHELLGMFLGGCDEALLRIEGCLLALDVDSNQPEKVSDMRGVIHTLKGECGVIPLPVAQQYLHDAESLIDRCYAAGKPVPVDALLALVDWAKAYMELLGEDPHCQPPAPTKLLAEISDVQAGEAPAACEGDRSELPSGSEAEAAPAAPVDETARINFPPEVLDDPTLPEFLSETRGHLEDAEAALLEVEADPENTEIVDRVFRTFHTIKGVAGFLNMQSMVDLAHSTEFLLDEFRKGRMVPSEAHSTLLFESCDLMGSMLEYLSGGEPPLQVDVDRQVARLHAAVEGGEAPVEPDGESPAPSATTASPEADAEPAPAATASPEPQTTIPAKAPPAKEPPKQETAQPRKRYKLDTTVKVATERLDSLVDMVGELVIAQQMVSQDPDLVDKKSASLQRNLTQVAKIVRDLQESAMSLRMVMLKSTFQKMSRLVRDVAHKSGKQVNLVLSGEDTELDRNVVEEISDPLVHLIRNAIDHGLESPDEREAAGKSRAGKIQLSAYHQGGSIVIEITDDGRGLNREKILAKAVERGLVPEGVQPDEIPDPEVFKMIFMPGFSTADQVTDISGRGVGMDVVRRNIENMRGKIEIQSTMGSGSTFLLRLPLTLAIIDGMIVRVGARRYVIPTLAVEQSFSPTPEQLHTVLQAGEVVDVRGALLPIHRLVDMFELDDGVRDPQQGILIVVEVSGRRACLLVDELVGQQQVVIKNLGKALPPIPGISGGAILGNGRVALILDMDALISAAKLPAA